MSAEDLRSESPRPEPARPGAIWPRLALAAGLGGISFFVLNRLRLLDFRALGEALAGGGGPIALIAGCLVAVAVGSAIRFGRIAARFRVGAPFHRIMAANLVSQAIAQWLPGSLAAAEVLRFGMMTNLVSRFPGRETGPATAGPRARVGLAILVDRTWGLGAMFAAGGLAGLVFLLRRGPTARSGPAVLLISLASLALGALLVAAPLLPEDRLRKLSARFLPGAGSGPARRPGDAWPKRWIRKAGGAAGRALAALAEGRAGRKEAAVAILLSLGTAVGNPLTLYFAARAVGYPLPLDAILAAVPLTVAAVFLPTGLAGYGGPQLLAAGVFGLFQADPGAVVAACLLQNTVVLAVQTVLGALGAAVALGRLRTSPRSL